MYVHAIWRSPYKVVRYERSLNRSSALVVSVRGGRLGRARDSRASLTPAVPLHRSHGLQSGDNLAHRVGVRAIVKPYVFGRLEKS